MDLTVPRAARPARWLALTAVLALAFALMPPVGAQAEDVAPARVDGQTRFHTAANVATLTFDQADVAHIAFAGDFPDALAASFAAGSVQGPILLAETDSVPAPTLAALEDLSVQQVVLVGGTAVLSEGLASELSAAGYDVDRVSGVNRYQTASAVAMRYGTEADVGEIEGQRAAILASGADFPDALAAGPVAAGLGLPLFLTPPETTEASVNSSLEQLDIERIIVVGGTQAVSAGVVEFYQDSGYDVERWSGATRTETARVIADNAVDRLGFTDELSLLARGDNFPDALTAGVHGGMLSAPLLLAATPTQLSDTTRGWLAGRCPGVETVRAFGGTAAISETVLDEAVEAAETCIEPVGIIGEASPEDRQSDPFPGEGSPAQLVEVRAAEHDGFDRVVFEFDGDAPGWVTRTEEPPLREDPSDIEIEIEGEAFIQVAFNPAIAGWADGTYDGPDRIAVGGDIVTEVVEYSDFEAVIGWAIGLEAEAAYAVGRRDGPTRIIIDIVHE